MPQKYEVMKKSVQVEQDASRLVAVVVAVMAISLVVFFVWGNNILTVI